MDDLFSHRETPVRHPKLDMQQASDAATERRVLNNADVTAVVVNNMP